jgi:hypothetical protein
MAEREIEVNLLSRIRTTTMVSSRNKLVRLSCSLLILVVKVR